VVAAGSPDAIAAWQAFTAAYPSWYTDAIGGESFPWAAMARAGQLSNDGAHAQRLLDTLEQRFSPSWSYPWYDAESGWFLLGTLGANP
jgi:hypothetical protein